MTKDWVHGVGHSPVCQILLQIVVRAVITSSPPAWTSSAGMLSTPADFPFFNVCTAASTSLRRMGWSSSVSVWVQFNTDGSPLALWLYNSEQYSVHRSSICRSSVRHFPERSWTVVTFSNLVSYGACGGSTTFSFCLQTIQSRERKKFALIVDFQVKRAYDQKPYSVYYKIIQQSIQKT